jgi:hypothetical protein
VLLAAYAVVTLIHLYPWADLWHALMTLPVFLVLLAYHFDRLQHALRAAPGLRSLSLALAVVLLAIALAPFMEVMLRARAGRDSAQGTFARARGITVPQQKVTDAAELVRFLESPAVRARPVFVAANEQMLYFLAGRRSPLEEHEFLFYLVGVGGVAPADAGRLVSEAELVSRLARTKPLVVDYEEPGRSPDSPLRRAFPALAEYLDRRCRVVERFGRYRVLAEGG